MTRRWIAWGGVGMLVCASIALGDGGRYRFVEAAGVPAAVIDPYDASEYAVGDLLFGKFTENLGANVYGGFWAQLLLNPSLEPLSVSLGRERYGWFDRLPVQDLAHRDLFRDGDEDAVGYRWHRWNGERAEYRLEGGAYNSDHCQAIRVETVPESAPGTGICQPLYLPAARTLRYRVRAAVRGAGIPLVAAVVDARDPGRVYGSVGMDPAATPEWTIRTATLSLAIDEDRRRRPMMFCIGVAAPGSVFLDQVTLLPDDGVEGFDPEVVALSQASKIRILRFPGGNYVSGYHWKDGIGPLDERPTRRNPAWPHCDPHHVGTDEHIRLCRLIGAEPLVCVNAGNGTPEEAADWVEYCNGGGDTEWGRVRAANGNPAPYAVRFWEIGNELWGPWQIGHCTPEEYAARYRAFTDAMKAVDPSIEVIACGHKGEMRHDWNDVLLDRCGGTVRSLALHLLFHNDVRAAPEFSYTSRMGYSHLVEDLFRSTHEKGRARGIDLKVAVTEALLPSSRAYQAREDTMAEALWYAGIVNAAVRTEGIVEIITHSALVNHGGGLRREFGRVYATPVYYARAELQTLAGTHPASFEFRVPFGDVPEWQAAWAGPSPKRFPLIDLIPLVGNGVLHVVLVNRHPAQAFPIRILLKSGRAAAATARVFELGGASFHAMNDPTAPRRVAPRRGVVPLRNPSAFRVVARPASLAIVSIPFEAAGGAGVAGGAP